MRHPDLMPTEIRATGAGKNMTLDELADFVEGARKAGAPGDRTISADLSTTGKIKEIAVVLSEDDD